MNIDEKKFLELMEGYKNLDLETIKEDFDFEFFVTCGMLAIGSEAFGQILLKYFVAKKFREESK